MKEWLAKTLDKCNQKRMETEYTDLLGVVIGNCPIIHTTTTTAHRVPDWSF